MKVRFTLSWDEDWNDEWDKDGPSFQGEDLWTWLTPPMSFFEAWNLGVTVTIDLNGEVHQHTFKEPRHDRYPRAAV